MVCQQNIDRGCRRHTSPIGMEVWRHHRSDNILTNGRQPVVNSCLIIDSVNGITACPTGWNIYATRNKRHMTTLLMLLWLVLSPIPIDRHVVFNQTLR